MKKIILFTFLFFSLVILGQAPTRFPGGVITSKLVINNSTNDSVLLGAGARKAISTIVTDTTHLSARINAKQDSLISGVNIKTINGSSIKGSGNLSIVAGGGGAGANVYLSDVNSSVSGYKTSSPNIDASESVKTITASTPNTVYWGEKYLYTSPISTTNIPSGLWSLHAFGNVNSAVGVSSVVFRIFKYSGSTETVLFTFTGYEVDNIEASEIIVTGGGTETTLLATDYIGIQVGFQTTAATAKTFTYTIGNGHASYSTNPLPLRHAGLRDKNGESDFQHVTTTQIGTWNSKEPGNSNIQAHIASTSNPHNVTKAQVGLSNVDNTSDLSKPISIATQTALNGKQPAGTYSTDIHSNITALNDVSGSNHGDETLTSIKTKLGSANSTTDGYLKYQDWNTFNNKLSAISYNQPSNASYQILWGSGNNIYGNSNITCNPYTGVLSATQFNGSGAGLTGLTSGQITTALGYTPLPNRSFGTAASNNTNDFILNQNSSAQSANLWISGKIRSSIINNASFISNWSGPNWFGIGSTPTSHLIRLGMTDGEGVFQSAPGDMLFQVDGAATFASTVNATGFLLNGNNLTSSLGTNYIPKWNGSNFVNSLIYDTGGAVGIGTSIIHSNFNVAGDVFFGNTSNTYGITFQQSSTSQRIFTDYYSPGVETQLILGTFTNRANQLILNTNGTVSIGSTAASNSPTTGALVVSGGIGSGGSVFASGFKTSRNSSSYLLATDGSDVAVSTIGNATSGGINPTAVAVSGITNIASVVGNYITVGTKTIYSFIVGITPSSAAQVFDVITPTNSSYGTVQITGSTNVTVGTCQAIAPSSYRISVNEPSISDYYLTVTIMY